MNPEREPIETDNLQPFIEAGGEIFDFDAEGNMPRRWKCGRDAAGHKVDPPGVEQFGVQHRLTHDGWWEGVIPNGEDEREERAWQG